MRKTKADMITATKQAIQREFIARSLPCNTIDGRQTTAEQLAKHVVNLLTRYIGTQVRKTNNFNVESLFVHHERVMVFSSSASLTPSTERERSYMARQELKELLRLYGQTEDFDTEWWAMQAAIQFIISECVSNKGHLFINKNFTIKYFKETTVKGQPIQWLLLTIPER